MNHKKLALGSIVYFARAGDNIDGAVVSAAIKPDIDPVENWTPIGEVLDLAPKGKRFEEETMTGASGLYQRSDVVVTGFTLDVDVTLNELTELTLESVFGAAGAIPLTGGTAGNFAPGAGGGQIRGWFKCQNYSPGATERLVFDLWGVGTFDTVKFENKIIKPVLKIMMLANPLNTAHASLT